MGDSAKRAIDSYNKDARFRMLAMNCVAAAMNEHGPIDPEQATQAAHDIALQAAVVLLQRVFEEDAELNAMRIECDRYRKLAEKALVTGIGSPPVIVCHERGKDGDRSDNERVAVT